MCLFFILFLFVCLFSLCFLCIFLTVHLGFFEEEGGGYWFQVFLGIWEGGIYENYLYIFFASAISK